MSGDLPRFQELPDDCTCLGEGPAPVSRVPRVGAMPELITYRCPACGHVETIEQQPGEAKADHDALAPTSAGATSGVPRLPQRRGFGISRALSAP